jgi:hypothetical protein
MSFTATQYLFKASFISATTANTVGSYTVPASTRGMILGLTVANSATSNAMNYADIGLYDGSTTYYVARKTPVPPGGSVVAVGVEKHVLPTGGSIQVVAYATTGIDAVATIVEIT